MLDKEKLLEFSYPKAFEILKRKDLFELVTEQEFDKKIVGEYGARKTIFLIGCGIFVENHNPASYNCLVDAETGIGKDFVSQKVLDIFPKEFVVKRTRISPTVLNYWHNSYNDPDWTWNGKILYLQDVSNIILNHEVVKVFGSEGSEVTLTIRNKAVDIRVEGKPALFITTATANPKKETLRRYPIINLDEGIAQTKAIMKRKAEFAGKGAVPEYSTEITEALRHLKRVKVKIPFAEKLVDTYPSNHPIMRTHFERLLDYIKASCALYQFQRKQDEEGYYLAEPEDYDRAIICLRQTTSNPFMIPLTKKQKMLLEVCKEYNKINTWFSIPDLEGRVNFLSERRLYDAMEKLQEWFFDIDMQERENSKKPVKVYRLKEMASFGILSWREINETNKTIETIDSQQLTQVT